METKKRPITSSLQAVRYALRTNLNPTDWPRVIHTDEEDRPLLRSAGGGFGFIYLTKRSGDPTPTDIDRAIAEAAKMAADQLDRRFIDYIIIGTDSYYSFADERIISFRPVGKTIIPMPFYNKRD